jgi:hypothetical protein
VRVQRQPALKARQQRLAVRFDGLDPAADEIRFVLLQIGKVKPRRRQRSADHSLGEAIGSAADFGAFGHQRWSGPQTPKYPGRRCTAS